MMNLGRNAAGGRNWEGLYVSSSSLLIILAPSQARVTPGCLFSIFFPFRYSGADPYLAGEAAYETILGIQSQGVQACAKHYVGNEQEHNRTMESSNLDDKTVRAPLIPLFPLFFFG
jgi:hypothetical protein